MSQAKDRGILEGLKLAIEESIKRGEKPGYILQIYNERLQKYKKEYASPDNITKIEKQADEIALAKELFGGQEIEF